MPECDTRIRPSAQLVDASDRINGFFQRALAGAASAATPRQRVDNAYMRLGAPVTLDVDSQDFNKTHIESFCESLPANVVFPVTQAQTKYSGVTFGVWSPRVLSPTLRIGDHYIGLDKLGHFAQQGHTYYHLIEALGYSIERAEEWGRQSEAGGTDQPGPPHLALYGLATTGVYSNADLVANRTGYDFYRAFHNGDVLSFDINDYVTAEWSEERNVSFYHEDIWQTVWSNLLGGSWRGHFTRPDGVRTDLTVQLTPGAGNALSGTYAYTDSTGAHQGTLNGHMVPYQPRPGLPVVGIYIYWSWTRGGNSGRGIWASKDASDRGAENVLNGTWGFGNSSRDGGAIIVER